MASSSAENFSQYGLMAERHWRQFRPKMVRRLEAQGKFEAAPLEAQERTIEEMETLYRRFKAEGLTEQPAEARAWELTWAKYFSFHLPGLNPPSLDGPL